MFKYFSKRAWFYIFYETLPVFILGVIIFISIMLMFQALRLTEFVLIHGVSLGLAAKMMAYLSISFLPALMPMSLLFAVILVYGRLSQDSEVVAFKASGVHPLVLASPGIFMALLATFLSTQTSFHLAPWGNRQFELIISKIGQSKASVSFKEGTFSQGFFDLVVYAQHVDGKSGQLEKVFIFDERTNPPLSVVANRGEIIQEKDDSGVQASIRLTDGDIHRKTENHTKIHFQTFDIQLFDPLQLEVRGKSPPSLYLEEISHKLRAEELKPEDRQNLQIEYHKRWALSFACFVFGLLGIGLGTNTNKRQAKNSGFILSFVVIVVYWIVYLTGETMARQNTLPIAVALWLPNVVFFGFSIRKIRELWV